MEIRERIIEEAIRQFLSLGIRNVTMDAIASSLGISKRTVYENFKDKNELVHICMDDISQQHEERNEEIISSSRNVIEIIFTFMKEGIKAMSCINPVFLSDLKKFYPEIWNAQRQKNDKNVFELTKKLLERGIEEGVFRQDINIPIVAKLFHEQMNLIADEKVFPREEYNYPDVFESVTINFMRGISTQKGTGIIEKLLDLNEN